MNPPAEMFKITIMAFHRIYVRYCNHCLSTTGGESVPLLFGSAVYDTVPNALLRLDHVGLAPSEAGCKYVLMLRDYHSYCKLLFVFSDRYLRQELCESYYRLGCYLVVS